MGYLTEWGAQSWYRDIAAFRQSPSNYLSLKKIDEEAFVLDILQALWEESVTDTTKVHLLGLLEQYAGMLLPSAAGVERTVASLLDIFHQTSVTRTFYKSQILVTITSVLLQSDQMEEQGQLFCTVVDLLLDIACRVNTVADSQLRGLACECLQEIETLYPGVLTRKLEYLYQISQMEHTHVFQSYMSLFVTALNNVVQQLAEDSISAAENKLSDILCNRKEPLKPFIIPEEFRKRLSKQEKLDGRQLPDNMKTEELKKAVSLLMDNTRLMTCPKMIYVLTKLIHIVKTSHLQVSMFKSGLLRFMPSLELTLFHLVFNLKIELGDKLMSASEESLLLQRLLISCNHPSLHPIQRLLMYHWLLHFPTQQGSVPTEETLPGNCHPRQYSVFFPTVFDSGDTQIKKLNVLSLCFNSSSKAALSSDTMMDCLGPLHKQVEYGILGRPAVALFRTLFVFFKRHRSTALTDDIHKFLVGIGIKHPKFSAYILDFVSAVRHEFPDSGFPVEVLTALLQHTRTAPLDQIIANWYHYLKVVERAAQETSIPPQLLLGLLKRLLSRQEMCQAGSWETGNCVLAICRSLLQTHDTTHIYADLGQILYKLMISFGDVDIRDRAAYYYALLTNLSSSKVSKMLVTASHESKNTQSLANMVTGGANFSGVSPVVILPEPVLQLTRIVENQLSSETCAGGDSKDLAENEILDIYQQHVTSLPHRPVIKMSFYLHFKAEAANTSHFDELYALVLQVYTQENYVDIKDIYIPCLKRSESCSPSTGCCTIELNLIPLQPVPSTVQIRAVFTTGDNRTYSSQLEPLEVKFENLFLPLTCPPAITRRWRHMLWEQLWQKFTGPQSGEEASSCLESVCLVPIKADILEKLIRTHLYQYVMEAQTTGEQSWRLGIFLPPSHHLLLKFVPQKNRTVVSIATDNYKILPMVSTYLMDLDNST